MRYKNKTIEQHMRLWMRHSPLWQRWFHSRPWKIIKRYRDKIRRWWSENIGWEDYLGGFLLVIGILGFFPGSIPYIPYLTDFYHAIWPELIGIGLAVLIIDNANESIKRREEKLRLSFQMGSPNHDFAIEAVRQLSLRGWLYDGSLRWYDLRKAHLSEANLRKADLSGVNLWEADLSWANLEYAQLSGADLSRANLRKATLTGTDLSGATLSAAFLSGAYLGRADLSGANLTGAINFTEEQLVQAILDENTIMPDGSNYKPPDEQQHEESR